ncbi:glycosyltransferase [Dysgonomonas sp. 521]|uniref:glycosyltransferase family 2 protein n=1 Tax=Dysgonomonas sp. 521 TaxID=2302932 RepID=UPI0013D35835|nr:glycosyltransferase family 2 protein [Dysgonomonas sp. 521]NDV95256.1 glycosyltransferase [Dysgonomonas sp. 521]
MKVSIITINYKNATGLRRTVESIINQRHVNFEYLIIDGNSDDGSVDIIKEFEPHIDYWVSEPDSGIYNAMNKGIRQATGDYILFVNSGDTIKKEANLQSVINQITGEDIVYFDMEIADNLSGTSDIKIYPDKPDFKYFAEDSLPHTASFIKKDLLVNYGYYSEENNITSDWAFFMDAVCLRNSTYKHISDCFSTFYIDGISSDATNRQLLMDERNEHIAAVYPLYNSVYKDWMDKKQELYKLKTSVSVRYLKKLGLLKWLKL